MIVYDIETRSTTPLAVPRKPEVNVKREISVIGLRNYRLSEEKKMCRQVF